MRNHVLSEPNKKTQSSAEIQVLLFLDFIVESTEFCQS